VAKNYWGKFRRGGEHRELWENPKLGEKFAQIRNGRRVLEGRALGLTDLETKQECPKS